MYLVRRGSVSLRIDTFLGINFRNEKLSFVSLFLAWSFSRFRRHPSLGHQTCVDRWILGHHVRPCAKPALRPFKTNPLVRKAPSPPPSRQHQQNTETTNAPILRQPHLPSPPTSPLLPKQAANPTTHGWIRASWGGTPGHVVRSEASSSADVA